MKLLRFFTIKNQEYDNSKHGKIIFIVSNEKTKTINLIQFERTNYKLDEYIQSDIDLFYQERIFRCIDLKDKRIFGIQYSSGLINLKKYIKEINCYYRFKGMRFFEEGHERRGKMIPFSMYYSPLCAFFDKTSSFFDFFKSSYKTKKNFKFFTENGEVGCGVFFPFSSSRFNSDETFFFVDDSYDNCRYIKFIGFDKKEEFFFDKSDRNFYYDSLEKRIYSFLPEIKVTKNEKNGCYEFLLELLYNGKKINETLYIKTNKGYISHRKLDIIDGKGKFYFVPLMLENGEEVSIKIGYKLFENIKEIKFNILKGKWL